MQYEGFSLWCLLLLHSTGSRVHRLQQLQHMGSVAAALRLRSSVIVAHRLSCSEACGIYSDQRGTSTPALQGGPLITGPPRSPIVYFLDKILANRKIEQKTVFPLLPPSDTPNGLWPARLLCPWEFPVKNPGVGCHFLLQRIFPT